MYVNLYISPGENGRVSYLLKNFENILGNAAKTNRGLTLPEVLITILLISILFSLAIVFSTNLRATKKMRNKEIAIALAQQAVEALRASPYDLLDDADQSDMKERSIEYDLNTSSGLSDLLEPAFNAGGVKYERKVEVTNVPPVQSEGTPICLKHIRVQVKWTTPDGEKLNYEITTAISNFN